ncbi:hypothetical protein P280DRAFT_489572 [Massarina eburnea CBS 473.64]|uniref:Uncharacterized protein n=1 Tax=Massarina eburnea CBS 473.64 TaxID=1395130 RepID=A0A6A6S0U6_9PLEO|nr:hypothetical protein P280DRAFT_489572 [Massarina eburnea CBS 473.64]
MPPSSRSPLFALAVSAGFVLVFVFGFLAWQSPPRMPFPDGRGDLSAIDQMNTPAITDIIPLLYSSLTIAPAEPTFSYIDDANNLTRLELPKKPRYKKKLGRDVLILDLETRQLPSTEDFKRGEFHWRKLNHVSAGVFNHYTYALAHGYDYKFIRAAEFEDRHATWIKPSALANHINDYKFIVFMDADATFRFTHLPVEWMLNYWKIEPHHSITMALDPWDPSLPETNADRFNRTLTNTGFMIVQNNANTQGILKAWHECPDDVRYQGCSEWKGPRFHEQSAFGEYIRYDYEKYIKELPCAEANGYPGVTQSHCEGRFVRHYWFNKFRIKEDFADNMMNAITLPLQRIFAENTNGVIYEQNKNVIY